MNPISVIERVPENNRHVLAFIVNTANGWYGGHWDIAVYQEGSWKDSTDAEIQDSANEWSEWNVTHWMELPNTPILPVTQDIPR